MSIASRIEKAENALDMGFHARPYVIVLIAHPPETEAERIAQEARTQARITAAIERRPTDSFILLC